MVLHNEGLWHQVLISKYMKSITVIDWLRYKRFSMHCVSTIWRGFLQTLPWMGNHLAWQVGDGENILLGVNPIVGAHTSYSIPEDMRLYLEDLDICTLSHTPQRPELLVYC